MHATESYHACYCYGYCVCRSDQEVWVSHLKLLLRECREACQWFMERMEAEGGKYLKYVRTPLYLHVLSLIHALFPKTINLPFFS